MKTIAKKIIGIMLIVMVGFFGWGVCKAEEVSALGEATPIAPFGAMDTTAPTFEWTSVPGATTYCLLIEDLEGEPVFLAWYSDEEAGCTAAESEVCAVTPSHVVHGDAWSVLPCMEGACGQWSNPAPFGVEARSTDTSEMRQTNMSPANRNCPQQQTYMQCREKAVAAAKACSADCRKRYPRPPQWSQAARHHCILPCIQNASSDNGRCYNSAQRKDPCVVYKPIFLKEIQ